MIKKYNKFNEGIKHLLTGPTEQEVFDNLNKLDTGKLMMKSLEINYLEGVKKALSEKNTFNMSAILQIACHYGHINIIKYLLENYDYKVYVLNSILEYQMNKDIKELLNNYINHINDNINEGIKKLLVGPTEKEILNNFKDNPNYILNNLHKFNWSVNAVKFAINNGSNINYRDGIPLTIMINQNSLDNVKYLINNGANILDKHIESCSKYSTPEILKLLIKNGADIHANNETPLFNAIESNNTDMVKILLDNGADIHINMDKPLEKSVEGNRWVMVKFLLENGADPNAKSGTFLEISPSISVAKSLLNAGANPTANNSSAMKMAEHRGWTEMVNLIKKYIK